jgi:hypothetical protein
MDKELGSKEEQEKQQENSPKGLGPSEQDVKTAEEAAGGHDDVSTRKLYHDQEHVGEASKEPGRLSPAVVIAPLAFLLLVCVMIAVINRLPNYDRRQPSLEPRRTTNLEPRQTTRLDPDQTTDAELQPIFATATPTAVPTPTAEAMEDAPNKQVEESVTLADLPEELDFAQTDLRVDPLFEAFYTKYGGEQLFGRPISPLLTLEDKQVQWFEYMRLEHLPPDTIRPGALGVEYTADREFPRQTFFRDRDGLRFFPQTSHGLGGKFLQYWEAHGGLEMFGYPISDELIEILPRTERYYTVQYFEHARFEWHPEASDDGEVRLGALGRELYLDEPKSNPLRPVPPTPVAIEP